MIVAVAPGPELLELSPTWMLIAPAEVRFQVPRNDSVRRDAPGYVEPDDHIGSFEKRLCPVEENSFTHPCRLTGDTRHSILAAYSSYVAISVAEHPVQFKQRQAEPGRDSSRCRGLPARRTASKVNTSRQTHTLSNSRYSVRTRTFTKMAAATAASRIRMMARSRWGVVGGTDLGI